MKALLIKTDQRKLEEVTLDPDNDVLEQIYEHLLIHNGSRLVQTVSLTQLGLPWRDVLLVDEEGKITASRLLGGFSLGMPANSPGQRRPYVLGRAMVLRINRHGRFVSPKLRLGVLRTYVEWDDPLRTQRLIHATEGTA